MNKTPFQIAREVKNSNRTSKVIKTKRPTELADKPTTVFDTSHSGYNSIDTLVNCPVCGVVMTQAVIDTIDGRKVPINYCLRHRTCLPTGVAK